MPQVSQTEGSTLPSSRFSTAEANEQLIQAGVNPKSIITVAAEGDYPYRRALLSNHHY
jgi:hypothetical protein